MSENNIFYRFVNRFRKNQVEPTVENPYPKDLPWEITTKTTEGSSDGSKSFSTEVLHRRVNGVDIYVRKGDYVDFSVSYPFNQDENEAKRRMEEVRNNTSKLRFDTQKHLIEFTQNKN